MTTEHQTALEGLLREAGAAHHRAFEAMDGHDPDWPIWYANYLVGPVHEQLGLEMTASQLVYCLMNADFERQARAPESDWPAFYAGEIIARFSPSSSPASDKLALYHFHGCPFCALVTSAVDRLGVEVESRDIHAESRHREDLIAARGRATVPVLRITSPDGEDRWMPESSDIVRYLEGTYG